MGGRWVEDCWWQKISMIITGNGNGIRLSRCWCWGRKSGRVLKSECFDIEMCELSAAFGHLHPPPLSWDRSPLGSIENWQYRLKYTELLSVYGIVSEIYFLSLPRDTTSQYLRVQDPLKVYSNANTWENFIAKVNNARDGFIGEINLSVLYGVWAELVPPYEVYQPQGPQGGKRTR